MGFFKQRAEGPPEPTTDEEAGDRRGFARVDLELAVAMRYETLADVVRCKTLDLSRSGVFIMTNRPRAAGTRVKLTLEIGSHALELDGVVVRVVADDVAGQAPGMGVMFTDTSRGRTMLLDALLAENLAAYRSTKTKR